MTQTHGVIDFYGTIWKHEKCVKVKKKPSIKNGVQNMEKNSGKVNHVKYKIQVTVLRN